MESVVSYWALIVIQLMGLAEQQLWISPWQIKDSSNDHAEGLNLVLRLVILIPFAVTSWRVYQFEIHKLACSQKKWKKHDFLCNWKTAYQQITPAMTNFYTGFFRDNSHVWFEEKLSI